MNGSSQYLSGVAGRIAAAYNDLTAPRAILLTGSVAEGTSDAYSDIDLIIYHETLPTEDALGLVRAELKASDSRTLSGEAMESFVEQFVLDGITCQVGHVTVDVWERDMALVLDAHTPATVTEKALSGLLDDVALHGRDLIAIWQTRAADYPDALARATVEQHLHVFPLWVIADSLPARDATIFTHQMLVEAGLNLLAVLAGLNRRYFSSFQFKHLRRFCAKLSLAPENLAERLDDLFRLDPVTSGCALEQLWEETIILVEANMPEIDTSGVRQTLGRRHHPWHEAPASIAGTD
jgi:hypothetical protein